MAEQRKSGGLRWLLRGWAWIATLVLLAIQAWVVWGMVDAGWPGALRSAPQALLYLGLIVVVWLIRLRGGRLWRRLLGQAGQALRTDARDDLVEAGRDRLEETYVQGRQKAQSLVADLGDKAEEGWQRLMGGSGFSQPPAPMLGARSVASQPPVKVQTCPICGQTTSIGAKYCGQCGAWMGTSCPACGRDLRPGMTFCDGCGVPLRAGGATDRKATGEQRRRSRDT